MVKGYKNCIIKVDLTNKSIEKDQLNHDYINKYMGGEGYGIALLWDKMNHDAKPLSPENILSFNTGPMTGTPTPSASRMSVCFLSPLTNTILHLTDFMKLAHMIRKKQYLPWKNI